MSAVKLMLKGFLFRYATPSLLALGLALPLPGPANAEGALGDLGFRQAIATVAAADPEIAGFYRSRDYRPLWVGEGDLARRRALVAAFAEARSHGLPADRHDPERQRALFASVATLRDLGRVEVETTRAFLSYARDIQSGILEPRTVDPGLVMEVPRRDRGETLAAFAAADDPAAFLRALAPQTAEYAALLREKEGLEALIERGGWGAPVASAAALKPGMEGAAVLALRDRLIRMGYLPMRASARYDAALQRAVQRFQANQGLTPDGIAGRETLDRIDTPATERLKQVIVALERLRWLNKPLGQRHIMVNQAAFQMKIVEDGATIFESDVIVGMENEKWRTPEFSKNMDHMIVNPTWHVPSSIVARDYLPKLLANPEAASYMRFYDASGRQVSRSSIDFSQFSASNFPYSLKQPPSDDNALGLVKFMLPNRWNIYLHDTPSKHLFSKDKRAFSSGCVRVQRPFELAYELLSKQTSDPRGTFHRALDSGRETRIDIVDPVPVHLTYRTAFADARGRVHYREDTYGRDGRIFAALAAAGVTVPGAES